ITMISNVINPFIDLIKNVIANFKSLDGSTNENFTNIKKIIFDVLGSAKEYIQTVLAIIMKIWDKYGSNILGFIKSTFNNILSVIQGVLKLIQGVFQVFVGLFTGDWKKMGEGLKNIVGGLWKIIETLFKQAIETIVFIVKNAGGLLLDAAKHILGMLWD